METCSLLSLAAFTSTAATPASSKPVLAAVAVLLGLLAALSAGRFLRRRHRAPVPGEEALAGLMAHLPGMVYRCRQDGAVELASSGAAELTGYTPEDFTAGGTQLRGLVHAEDRGMVEAEIRAAVEARRPYQMIYRLLTRDGTQRWAWETGQPVGEAEALRLEGLITDITARKTTEDRLLHEALHDPLTDLPNRSLLIERLGGLIRRSLRRPLPAFALLYVDLDRFQLISDSLGRELGDQVLQATARRLQACLRQEDTVARMGGDEFVVLLEEVASASDAVRVAHRLGEVVGLPLYLAGEEVTLTASIGIASSLSGYESPEHPLRDAEIALRRAKAQGGGGQQLFDSAMHAAALSQMRLETDLRRALKHQELRLLYQPIFELPSGRLAGFEALLRWQRQDQLLLPADFLATAQETGLIVPMSWWVLSEACRQILAWQRRFPAHRALYVSVNLTSQQLGRPDLRDRVRNVLQANGLSPQSLRIEVTESVVMERTDSVVATLAGLREMGIHISLDDFGTGYSSLSLLRQLPIASLKIDRSFVSTLEARTASLEIVRALVALAHNLGLSVVAEGVETAEQRKVLTELGCDDAQGFLLARPLTAAAVEELLAEELFADEALFNDDGRAGELRSA